MTPAKPKSAPDDAPEYPCAPCRVIASEGVWRVPPTGRPRGWQSMGLREPERQPKLAMERRHA